MKNIIGRYMLKASRLLSEPNSGNMPFAFSKIQRLINLYNHSKHLEVR